jgi:hypothetical protein
MDPSGVLSTSIFGMLRCAFVQGRRTVRDLPADRGAAKSPHCLRLIRAVVLAGYGASNHDALPQL